MERLKIDFENCYWIKKLEHDFYFSEWKKSFIIYAANWIMKTSFSKTFNDFSKWVESKDLVHPNKITKRIITDENGVEIAKENIFVIESYKDNYSSERMSTLIVNNDLKKEYDKIYHDLAENEDELIKKLKKFSWSSNCKEELLNSFISDNNWKTFLEIIHSLKDKINSDQPKYTFKYNDVFDKKWNVEKFLKIHWEKIKKYIEKYNEILQNSTFFSNSGNKFWTYQAKELWNAVSDNSFFDAWHKLIINWNQEVTSPAQYQDILNQEIERVINNPELKDIFETIDKAISANAELKAFRKVIDESNDLLIKLENYNEFKKEVWISYLFQMKEDTIKLIDLYDSKIDTIKDIIEKAKTSRTARQEAVDEFNTRFINMPFTLYIDNKEDIMLKMDHPVIKFKFNDSDLEFTQDEKEILNILSQWEKRALYLLNIIFEIKARENLDSETIFIIDDIADSFDYKNKYAIIQYLNDIHKNNKFYQIILTHNFDFYRTIQSRILWTSKRSNSFIALKDNNKIQLEKFWNWEYQNPFQKRLSCIWRENWEKYIISCVPFIRNLIEFSDWNHSEDYKLLTALLHQKRWFTINWQLYNSTNDITLLNIEPIFNKTLGKSFNENLDKSISIEEQIYTIADSISNDEPLNLANKIILSIAIRLKTETYILSKINISDDELFKMETWTLFEEFKTQNPLNVDDLDGKKKRNLIESVLLMVSENIHINSFMYEPLIDISTEHLINLYNRVKSELVIN